MTRLIWDDTGKRLFETGIDKAVLYLMDANGSYPLGVPWNGLTSITESPSGAEPNPLYGDNIKYLTLMAAEGFAATLEAYTYPEEFGLCDGSDTLHLGGIVSQQPRKKFGLVYRTKLGNDVGGQDLGYKLHLIYGCLASPSEKAYASINESPEAITFSWEIATTPINVTGFQSTSLIIVDSTQTTVAGLNLLEDQLFGDGASGVANLPLPDAVKAIVGYLPQTLPRYLLSNYGTLYEGFETFGDWTAVAGSAESNTTSGEFRQGTKSIKVTSTVGSHGAIEKVFGSPINFGGVAPHMRLYFYLYADSVANGSALTVEFYNNSGYSKSMGSLITFATQKSLKSGWNVYDIPPAWWTSAGGATWNDSFDRMWVRITALAATQFVASFDNLLIGLVNRPACLMIFDDANASVYNTAFQYMRTKGVRGTFYVRTGQVNTGAYVTSTQLQAMDAAGWSIANHTKNHTYLTTLSQADATAEILAGKSDLVGWGLSRNANYLAYPGCYYNDTVIAAAVAAGVLSARACANWSSCLDAYVDDRYTLQINRAILIGNSLATIKADVDKAYTNGQVLGLLIHTIPGDITVDDFHSLIDYIISKGIPFITINDFYNLISGPVVVL